MIKKIKSNIIDNNALLEAGLIKKKYKKIKILGKGEIKRSFEIKGISISKTAKNKIEAAGRKINE